jgi:outer membrane protein TolC
MSNHEWTHTPTPEFRASLERDVLQALREETRSDTRRRFARFRTPMTLAAGLVLGMGSQFAAGQVQRGRERSELEVTIDVKRAIAGSRLELARASYEQAKRGFDVGAITRPALMAAEAELRAAEANAYRLQLDLQEVRETSLAPRDELWAPLVGGRDFVKDRLTADASAAQRKLESVEAAVAEIERSFRAGAITQAALDEARATLEEAKSAFELVAYKLTLRRQSLADHVKPDVTSQQLAAFELSRDLQRLNRQLQLVQAHYESARARQSVGLTDSLAVLRLHVRMLESTAEIQRIQAQLRQLRPKGIE